MRALLGTASQVCFLDTSVTSIVGESADAMAFIKAQVKTPTTHQFLAFLSTCSIFVGCLTKHLFVGLGTPLK